MKIKITFLTLLAILIASTIFADQTPKVEIKKTKSEVKTSDIKSQVRALRQERRAKMPYLNRGFINSEIRADKILEKNKFASSGQKQLNDMIARAIQTHTPARAARERISLARRRMLAALRGLFPEATFQVQKRGGTLSGDQFNSFNYRLVTKQPLFRGGILWNTLLQEKAGLQAAEKEYTVVIEDLAREVAVAYFEYNRASQVVQGQAKALEEMKHYAEISKEKFKAQIISEIEHLNVQSLYSQMQYDFETSKQELELAKLDLQRYLNLGINDPLEIRPLYKVEKLLSYGKSRDESQNGQGFYPLEAKKIPSLSEFVDLAYQHRAELQVESAKLDAARLQERVRWGEMMPHADITLEWGKLAEAFDTQSLHPPKRNEVRAALELNWNGAGNKMSYTHEYDKRAPSVTQFLQGVGSTTHRDTFNIGILDGLSEIASIKEAEVARLDQIVALEKAEKEVIQSVKQSFFDYQKAKIQVKSTLQRVNYRKRLAAFDKHKLEKNEIQISEYLQAEIDLMQELTALNKALSDYFTAKVKLNHAIGQRNYLPVEDFYGPPNG